MQVVYYESRRYEVRNTNFINLYYGEFAEYELLDYYKNNFRDNVFSDFNLFVSDKYSTNLEDRYYSDGEEYFKNFDGAIGNLSDFKILSTEYEFKHKIKNKFYFTGKVDLTIENEHGDIIIVDHKSKGKFKSKKEKAEYFTQLYLYSIYVYRKYKKFPKYLCFNMFRINKVELIEFNKEDYNKSMEWLINGVEKIEEEFEFSPNIGTFYCNNFCEFRESCEERDEY